MNNKLKVTSKVTKLGVWNDIPSDSINSFILEFEFDEEWADLVCVAQFGQGNNTYNQLIVDNMCALPTELNVGELRISVFGSKTDGTAYRSTTIPLATEIIQSGFDGHGEDTIPPSPDLYEQLLEEFSNGGVHSLNTLKGDISLVGGENVTITTDTENGEIAVNVAVDYKLSDTSENPVQNKVIKSALDGKLDKTGGAMTGMLNMGGNTISQVGQMTFLNNKIFNMNNGRIINLAAPTIPTGAANKQYVDNAIAAALIVDTEEAIP